jgi:ABC-type lipoprotein release transport system permease subunit
VKRLRLPGWLERQRYLLDFTLSSLGRRKGKNLALASLYTLVVFGLASVLMYTQALRGEALRVLAGAPDVVVQRMVAGRHDLISGDRVERLSRIRGVQSATGRLWGYYYDASAKANLTFLVPEKFWGKPGEVVIGEGVARTRLARPGEPFPVLAADGSVVVLKVRETIPSASELVSADLVLLSEPDFRRLFGVPPDLYTDVALAVPNEKEVATVASKIRAQMPDTRPVSHAEIARTYEAILDWRSGLVVLVLAAALLSFGIVAWDKASGLSADERREIGILKAIGWDTSEVLAVKVWEGAVISLSAFLIGLLLAYVHVFVTPAPLLAPVLKGWSTLYPDFRLTPALSPFLVSTLFLLTVVPYTVATVVPAWRAATTDPDEVMRS